MIRFFAKPAIIFISLLLVLAAIGCHPSDDSADVDSGLPEPDDDDDDNDTGDDDDDSLIATVLDVGLGDSILIESPDQVRMLVDGGSIGEGQFTICPFLEAQGIERIDLLVMTHPHFDHVGGLSEIFECVEVGAVWTNGRALDEESYNLFADALTQWGGTVSTPQQGDTSMLGTETQIMVLNTGGEYPGDDVVPVNNDSLVLMVGWSGWNVLLGADVDIEEQNDLVADYGDELAADLVKIPNHAKGPHSETFVEATASTYAVCSVGDNELGYPADETLNDYAAEGATVYRTDEVGTVRVTYDGVSATVETGL